MRHRIQLAVFASLVAALVMAVSALGAEMSAPPQQFSEASKPYLLVASPAMSDSIFQQAVILMLPSAAEPIVAGIIVNKPSDVTLGQLFRQSPAVKNQKASVYFGGPVELTSPALLLRSSSPPDTSTRLFDNVFIITGGDSIAAILKRERSQSTLRLFLGRAQWTPEQLRGEVLQGAWSTAPADPDLIFSSDPAKVWRSLAKQTKIREVGAGPADDPFGFGLVTPPVAGAIETTDRSPLPRSIP